MKNSEAEIPVNWISGMLSPLHKKGDNYYCGFRRNNRSDQIFVMEKNNIDLFILLIDFKQAFDDGIRNTFKVGLDDLEVLRKLNNLIMLTIYESNVQVKINNQFSDPCHIYNGVRQGDGLLSTLFNIYCSTICPQVSSIIFNKSTQISASADDSS